MTEPLLYSAEPVFEVEGTVRGELTRDLLRLDIREDTEGLKTLVARVAGTPAHPDMPDVPELYLNGSLVDFGKKLSVALGPSAGARTVFQGHVSAIEAVYAEWSSRGAEFLTPPQDRGAEIRCYLRDPDGHLIEVGQTNRAFLEQ